MELNIKDLTDEDCISLITALTADRVTIGTGYISNEEKTLLTHSFLLMTCGQVEAMSEPQSLTHPFIPLDFVKPPKEMVN